MSSKRKVVALAAILIAAVSINVFAQGAAPAPAPKPKPNPAAPKAPAGPPMLFGVVLPAGAKKAQKLAGTATYTIPDSLANVEKTYVAMFAGLKDVSTTSDTVGGMRIVIFEDRGSRPWSTIQISGWTQNGNCYFSISDDRPAVIDAFP